MVSRRDFLKRTSLAAGAVLLHGHPSTAAIPGTQYFGLNDFVDAHPDAVFILKTAVAAKTDTTAIKGVGYDLGRTLFVPKPDPAGAFPVTANVAIKPNITNWAWDKVPIETTMGIQTDPYFVEGIIESLRDLAVDPGHIYLRDGNFYPQQVDGQWYGSLAARTGANLKRVETLALASPDDVQWVDVPEGVWFRRIAYVWPFNSPDSCLINIAKLKSHRMGVTLCAKNLQGTNVQPYIGHCRSWGQSMPGVNESHIAPSAFDTIRTNYDRHRTQGIPRWRTLENDPAAGSNGGLWQETHASRCLDNNSAIHPLLNIIEGVYGREGPFVSGPADNNWYGRDLMANLVIFGRNTLHVDNIGTYFAGHEPGNFGIFHLAHERGLSYYLDPRSIPLYEWKPDGTAVASSLASFPRTPLRTPYLPQAGEDEYHMLDQPYDYSATSLGQTGHTAPALPSAIAVSQNFPNPFNPTTSIQYSLPSSGPARLEIYDVRGDLVDVLEDGYMSAGDHLRVWDASRHASGTYYYRLLFGGTATTRSMLLIK